MLSCMLRNRDDGNCHVLVTLQNKPQTEAAWSGPAPAAICPLVCVSLPHALHWLSWDDLNSGRARLWFVSLTGRLNGTRH